MNLSKIHAGLRLKNFCTDSGSWSVYLTSAPFTLVASATTSFCLNDFHFLTFNAYADLTVLVANFTDCSTRCITCCYWFETVTFYTLLIFGRIVPPLLVVTTMADWFFVVTTPCHWFNLSAFVTFLILRNVSIASSASAVSANWSVNTSPFHRLKLTALRTFLAQAIPANYLASLAIFVNSLFLLTNFANILHDYHLPFVRF